MGTPAERILHRKVSYTLNLINTLKAEKKKRK